MLSYNYQEVLKLFSIEQYQPQCHELLTKKIKELTLTSQNTTNLALKCE